MGFFDRFFGKKTSADSAKERPAAVDVPVAKNRAAVQADPQVERRLPAQRRIDLQRRPQRRAYILVEKDECHAVAGGNADERPVIARPLEGGRVPHRGAELLDYPLLHIRRQPRVADHIHEKHVRHLRLRLLIRRREWTAHTLGAGRLSQRRACVNPRSGVPKAGGFPPSCGGG